MALSVAAGANSPRHTSFSSSPPAQATPPAAAASPASIAVRETSRGNATYDQRKALASILTALKPAGGTEALAIEQCQVRTSLMSFVATGSWMVMAFIPASPATFAVVIGTVGGFGLLLAATAVDQYATCRSAAFYGRLKADTLTMHSRGRTHLHAAGKGLQGATMVTHAALVFAGVLHPTLGVGLAVLGVMLGLHIAFEIMARVADARQNRTVASFNLQSTRHIKFV